MQLMCRIALVALVALVALAMAAVPASAAKTKSCGNYAKNDGSLADGVVLKIKVVGMSCRAGQTVANGYSGITGTFKAYGFKCLGVPSENPPQKPGLVRCVKDRKRVSYNNGPMVDCSNAPGIVQQVGPPLVGPWTYNASCTDAVTLVNGGTVTGWNCPGTNVAQFCNMKSGKTWEVVQWDFEVTGP
jgi:hypothetical protein